MNIIKTYESDWLGSQPIFYNTKTFRVSSNINDVIDFRNLEFHPEGLNNYLEFGYSVFEQTPIKDVHFLRWSSRLNVFEDGTFAVEYLEDPAEAFLSQRTDEGSVLDFLAERIHAWEKKAPGKIVIPTSGGLDSRLLNCLIEEKKRIRSYTYGISGDQSRSYEVVFAKELSNILGTKWEQIPLGYYHNYFSSWDDLYGIATHAHGMYQMEFYDHIRKKIPGRHSVLSGIIGDAWAGSVKLKSIDSLEDVVLLGYSHGMHADPGYSRFTSDQELKKTYLERNRAKFNLDSRWKIVEAMRFKMILLSYLVRVPQLMGFDVYAPFLDIDIAMSMLNLPAERRKDRIWQRDFFKRKKVNLEDFSLQTDRRNTLNLEGTKKVPLEQLNAEVLSEVVDREYVELINRRISKVDPDMIGSVGQALLGIPLMGRVYKMCGYTPFEQVFLKAYFAYLTLKPIENILLKRNNS